MAAGLTFGFRQTFSSTFRRSSYLVRVGLGTRTVAIPSLGLLKFPHSTDVLRGSRAWPVSTLPQLYPPATSRHASSSAPHRSVSTALTKLLPASLQPDSGNQTANIRQLFSLAKPEKKTLLTAFGLLLISSSVTMSVPLTFGKLIDFFSNGIRPDIIPESITPATAAVTILAIFTVGAAANAGRVILMRSAAARIIARLRKATYTSALRQDIEYLERTAGPGDVVSRLNADAYIVGDS
ncbi:ATP-binding cassette permease mdl1 [Ceratobasidium sp. 428]|nr:ATP-binding cassette permease mdl1 [Ceratobasidium sp. 428]